MVGSSPGVELHFHALPGVDDGPVTVADSVELAYKRAANLEEAARATLTMLRLGDTTTVCPPAYLETIRAQEAAARAGH